MPYGVEAPHLAAEHEQHGLENLHSCSASRIYQANEVSSETLSLDAPKNQEGNDLEEDLTLGFPTWEDMREGSEPWLPNEIDSC